jgi:hypothetical protein
MLTIGVLVVVMNLHQHGVDFVSGLRREFSWTKFTPSIGGWRFPISRICFFLLRGGSDAEITQRSEGLG